MNDIQSTEPADQKQILTEHVRMYAGKARTEKLAPVKVRHVVACGRALQALRPLIGRGEWDRWLREKCGITRMTALRYVRLANRTERLTAYMGIREAYIAAGVIAGPNEIRNPGAEVPK